MKFFATTKFDYSADLFAPIDPSTDTAGFNYVRRVNFKMDTKFGASMSLIAPAPLPIGHVLRNFKDTQGQDMFVGATAGSAQTFTYKIRGIVPILNDLTGVELYSHTVAVI